MKTAAKEYIEIRVEDADEGSVGWERVLPRLAFIVCFRNGDGDVLLWLRLGWLLEKVRTTAACK